ncbi:MAG: dTDP-4-dehydrorhamnose 3,5-epimerase family protein [Hyphomicrobiales bacterium]
MKLDKSPLDGCFTVHLEPRCDERGWFKRTFDRSAFQEFGLPSSIDHTALSFNAKAKTLRGLHFQSSPAMEEKLVQCVQGSIFDVVVDIRPNSRTLGRWFGIELQSTSHIALFVGKGFAHGFLTLRANTLVSYHMTQKYDPALSRGIRWDDPHLAIKWPKAPAMISKHDEKWPNLAEVSMLDLDFAGNNE